MSQLPTDFKGSLGEYLYKSMKQLPRKNIFQVNGISGGTETVQTALQRTISVAEGLRKQGVKCEDVVAIVSNYSANSIAVTLGTIFLGASPFPIDPSLKKLELQHMFKVANPKIIFIEYKKVQDALSASDINVPIYLLDEKIKKEENTRVHDFCEIQEFTADVEIFEGYPIERPTQQIAAVLPSSGTTGLPKGVAISHQSLFLQLMILFDIARDDIYLQLTPLFWSTGFIMLLLSLISGFTRVYMTENSAINIITAVHKYKPKYGLIAPIYLARILNYEDLDKYDLSSLDAFAVGGSCVPHSTIQLCKEKLPHLKITQIYGATEIGFATIPFDENSVHSAGKFFPIHTVKIVDLHSKEALGRNQKGEIIIKSPTTMSHYLLNEVATQEAFDSEGFYHTGDIGYEGDNGYIYISGRIKELFKVKNHQVSPVEIENVIRGLKGVADIAVVGIPHEIDQNHPKALVVKEPGSSITEQQVIDEVADKLSESKHLLAGVQFVNLIPRNVNGKLKRNELLPMVVM